MVSRAARTGTEGSLRLEEPAADERSIVVFKDSQARAEQFATGHDDDIEAWRDVISTKNLSNQTLSTISYDRSAEPLCRGNPEPAGLEPIRLREQRVIAARNPGAMLVDVLKVGVSADPLALAELQEPLFAADR